jgi:hypothetical protein
MPIGEMAYQLEPPVTSGLPTIQKLSQRDPHRKASQPAVALMLYTQQAASVAPKFYLQSAK